MTPSRTDKAMTIMQENGTRSKGKIKKNKWKVGTWNIRGLNNKEQELVREIRSADIDILGITETKKKGQGELQLDDQYMLIYSGVQIDQRAKAGVGCVVNEKWKSKVVNWTCVSERILAVVTEEGKNIITIIIAYGPSEDEKAEEKEKFWEEMSNTIEMSRGKKLIIGDLNARVGKKESITEDVIGNQGESIRNDNGRRLINYCIENDLIITNTFYTHKDIHKFTRVVSSRGEKSIIDYVIIDRSNRKMIKDTRVKRSAEIYSDHYLVVAKVETELENKVEKRYKTEGTAQHETIKTYKLRNEDQAMKYCNLVEIYTEDIMERVAGMNMEEMWKTFKDILLKSAKEICGTAKINKNKKQTPWWNNEIKEQIKIKKKKWKEYLVRKTNNAYLEYKKQRSFVKNLVREAKRTSWEDFGKKMEKNSKENQKLFYKVLKNLRSQKQNTTNVIKSKEGLILTKKEEIMERWRRYFEDLLNPITGRQTEQQKTKTATHEENPDRDKKSSIQEEEVREAIKSLKYGKAAGHDGIVPEMVKALGEKGISLLTVIFKKAWEEGKIPQDWEIGVVLPLFKKGDKMKCENYRGITLLCVAEKIYERILETKLRNIIEAQLVESQSGFRKGRSIQDHIFTLKQVTEKTLRQNTEMYLAFLDLEKAFDRVPRRRVWETLEERNIDRNLIRAIKSIYQDTRNYVRTKNAQSKEFKTKEGLRQGGVLSPLLFIIVMDEIIRRTREKKKKKKKVVVGYHNLEPVTISECAFADDLVIFGTSEQDLKEKLEDWVEVLREFQMKVNLGKSKIMAIAREDRKTNIEIEGVKMEQINEMKYLGVVLSDKGKQQAELSDRIAATANLYHAISNSFIGKKEISKRTKMSVFKSIYRPVLTFGSESWVLSKRQKNKIQAMEMKYLRRTLGVTKRDHIKNEEIRRQLEIEPVAETVERHQLRWFGHIVRMGHSRQVKRVWEARVNAKRSRGRPPETWNDAVSKTLLKKGITWNEAKKLASNKKEWAKFVYNEMQ